MIEEPPRNWGSRGKFWRQFGAGDPVNAPIAEWAYYSPHNYFGLPQSSLREASTDIQRETALIWFLSNYKPYALGSGPYFSFAKAKIKSNVFNTAPLNSGPLGGPLRNRSLTLSDGFTLSDGASLLGGSHGPLPEEVQIAGFNQAPFAPARAVAATILNAEFGHIIRADVLQQLSGELTGDWIRSSDLAEQLDEAGMPKVADSDLSLSIISRVEALEKELEKLRPMYGGVGHNSAWQDGALTEDEHAEFRQALQRTKTVVASHPTSEQLANVKDGFEKFIQKIGLWLLDKADTLVTEAMKSIGKKTGEIIVTVLVLQHTREIVALIGDLAKAVGRH